MRTPCLPTSTCRFILGCNSCFVPWLRPGDGCIPDSSSDAWDPVWNGTRRHAAVPNRRHAATAAAATAAAATTTDDCSGHADGCWSISHGCHANGAAYVYGAVDRDEWNDTGEYGRNVSAIRAAMASDAANAGRRGNENDVDAWVGGAEFWGVLWGPSNAVTNWRSRGQGCFLENENMQQVRCFLRVAFTCLEQSISISTLSMQVERGHLP